MQRAATGPAGLRIFQVRGQAVILDNELARLFGVEVKVFNQAVRRNVLRFPSDFMFQLTAAEWRLLRSQIVTLKKAGQRRHRKHLPWAFTKHGAIMAASVLRSRRAVAMIVHVVRAFVRLRQEMMSSVQLEARLAKIEKSLLVHDVALRNL